MEELSGVTAEVLFIACRSFGEAYDRRHQTTAGYAHLAGGQLVKTAETIGSIIAEAMIGWPSAGRYHFKLLILTKEPFQTDSLQQSLAGFCNDRDNQIF